MEMKHDETVKIVCERCGVEDEDITDGLCVNCEFELMQARQRRIVCEYCGAVFLFLPENVERFFEIHLCYRERNNKQKNNETERMFGSVQEVS